MADSTQNDARAPVFVAPTGNFNQGADLCYTSPDSAYPPSYVISQQPQQKHASCKSHDLIGRISVIVLGVVLVVCSVISQIGAAVGFRYFAGLSEAGVGIWCGYMFMATGIVAMIAAHQGTRKLIIATTVTAALSVVAALTQLSVAAAGLAADLDYYNCYRFCYGTYYYYCDCFTKSWVNSAVGANATMIFAALLALIDGIWLLVASCIAIHRKRTSFEAVSTPVQFVPNAPEANVYENVRNEQMHSTPVQYAVQQQPQMMPLNQQHANVIHSPLCPQVVQMQVPYIQTMTNSSIPNQQVFQVPVHLILNASQLNFNEQNQNQQMQSVLVHQQPNSLNHPPPNTYASAQHHEDPKNDDSEAGQRLRFHPNTRNQL